MIASDEHPMSDLNRLPGAQRDVHCRQGRIDDVGGQTLPIFCVHPVEARQLGSHGSLVVAGSGPHSC